MYKNKATRFIVSLLGIVLPLAIFAGSGKAVSAGPDFPIIFDLHSDTIGRVYRTRDPLNFNSVRYQAGLPNLISGGVTAQFAAVGGGPKGLEYEYVDGEIDFFYRVMKQFGDRIAFAGNAADLRKNLAAGKISCFLAMEGAEPINGDLTRVDLYYRKGVRYITLTWNYSNRIADAAKDANKPYGGLSPFGEKVVRRMNELGILVDVSHASAETVRDVLALSSAPVIASHSNSSALWAHKRNLGDGMIRGICSKGGVIGVNFFRAYITGRKPAQISDLAAHIDRIRDIGGIGCPALGSDYDGFIIPPAGLENYSKLSNLTDELVNRGYSKEDIAKIYGLNALRVVGQVLK